MSQQKEREGRADGRGSVPTSRLTSKFRSSNQGAIKK